MTVTSISSWRSCAVCGTPLRPKNKPTPGRPSRGTYCSHECSCEARRISPADQIRLKVDRTAGPDACWPWTGRIASNGYGRFWHHGQSIHAHVAAWELANERSVPDGLLVRHTCAGGGNAWCCNPAHLAVGTHQDNSDDKVAAGRQNRGEHVNTARLTPSTVIDIRRRHQPGHAGKRSPNSASGLAREYGVTDKAILAIVHGKTWRHVP